MAARRASYSAPRRPPASPSPSSPSLISPSSAGSASSYGGRRWTVTDRKKLEGATDPGRCKNDAWPRDRQRGNGGDGAVAGAVGDAEDAVAASAAAGPLEPGRGTWDRGEARRQRRRRR
mmetsp:Transcript_29112/g.65242  ORF Transcript_29112/g.65242 Transcript_29112/m.65242 type:complete len:119 (+) Transcript_29112:128-484(+)